MTIHSSSILLQNVPDNLTVPQLMFDYQHECRPARSSSIPWLVEDGTGRAIGIEKLRQSTFGLANGLRAKFGTGENHAVLIFSQNHIDYPITVWAVHQLGGHISGANPDFSSDELLYQLEQTGATLMIVHPDSLDIALSAARHAKFPLDKIIVFNTGRSLPDSRLTVNDLIKQGLDLPSDQSFVEKRLRPGEAKNKLAFLCFSSGTTGKPKAVAISHYSVIANIIQLAVHNNVNKDYCDLNDQRYRPGDVAIGVLPLHHIYGLVINLHYILFCAMSLVIVPKFNFVEMLDSIVRHKISHLLLVPPQIALLCKHPAVKKYDLRRYVRFVSSGAAPLSPEMNQQLVELLPDAHIGQGYGMTETGAAVSLWPITQKRGTPGSAGQLLPGTSAKVIKPDESLARGNEASELYIKTPSIALGYTNDDEATKETFIDGWVRTGDEGKIDPNGEIWILDRLKEIMKVKGFQVAPAELEGCILDHEDVSSACVVSVPDDYSGEIPLAFVVLSVDAARRLNGGKADTAEIKKSIIQHVANNKVSYKHLAGGVEFIDAVPVSPSGKLLRRVLREEAKGLRKAKSKL